MNPKDYDPFRAPTTRFSLAELAIDAGLDGEGWTYDTALPQGWVEEVYARTKMSPVGMGIVWAYGPRGSMGNPFALTREGAILMRWAASTP
jgi:hypothetical protein